jgi:hypothetical protein
VPVKSPKRPRKIAITAPVESPVEVAGETLTRETEKIFPQAVMGVNRIRVQREDDYSKKIILHGYMNAEEQSEARVSDLWGGGKYRCCMMAADEKGVQFVETQKEITLLGAYKRPHEIYGLQGSTAATAPAAMVPGTPAYQVTVSGERMSPNEALNAVLVNQVLETVKASKAVHTSDIPWDRLFDIGIKLVEVFGQRNGESKIEGELADIRAQLRQPAAGPVTSGIGDVAKAIESLMDVRDRIKGVDPDDDGERGGSMWKLADRVMQMIQQQQGKPAEPNPLAGKQEIVVSPGRPSDVAPHPPERPPDPRPMWQQMLAHYRPQLVDAARADFDSGFIADMAAAKIPPDLRGVVAEFLRRPDAAAIAVREIPELAEFTTWNTTFWAELKNAVLGDGEEAES